MALHPNKQLMRTIFDAINNNQIAALEGHPDLWETRQVIPLLHTIFTNWETTALVQLAEGDLVFSYGALTAEHVGQFAGVAATHRRLPIEVLSLDRVVDGKVVAHNSASTWYSLLRTLDVAGFGGWEERRRPDLAPFSLGRSDAPLRANKALTQRLLAVLCAGDSVAAAPHDGVGGLVDEIRAIRSAFPDLDYTPVAQVAEGELVGTRATLRGIWRAPLFGLQPTGQQIAWDIFSLDRVVAGRIVAHCGTADWNAALGQLGIFTVHMDAPAIP